MQNNGFFKQGDERVEGLPLDWWSRPYEYAWAIKYAEAHHVVADMGCGWMDRPFRGILGNICSGVYAVDGDPRMYDLPPVIGNACMICADFTKQIKEIETESLDRVFCISVLEDLGPDAIDALAEFGRVIKPGGLIVITMDMQHDYIKILGEYPVVILNHFIDYVDKAGLGFVGDIDRNRDDIVFREDFNLCCYHCVLAK